jgi:hypothetical protein
MRAFAARPTFKGSTLLKEPLGSAARLGWLVIRPSAMAGVFMRPRRYNSLMPFTDPDYGRTVAILILPLLAELPADINEVLARIGPQKQPRSVRAVHAEWKQSQAELNSLPSSTVEQP